MTRTAPPSVTPSSVEELSPKVPTGEPRQWAPGRRRLVITATILLVMVVLTFIGPLLPLDPARTVAPAYEPASMEHLLGTDSIGRDVLARLVHGGWGLLLVSALATCGAVLVGVMLGLLLSIRTLATRALAIVVDLVLVIPPILSMLVIIFGLGGGITTMVVITVIVSAPFIARFTRTLTTQLLDAPFVLNARLNGDSWTRVTIREILPNLAAPLAADAGIRFVGALYLVAAAGFLGFNPLGSDNDWATMIQTNLPGLNHNPVAILAPALAIMALSIPANLLADQLIARVMR